MFPLVVIIITLLPTGSTVDIVVSHGSRGTGTGPQVVNQKHAADAALLAGSTVSPWKTSFRGDMNRNLQAPQNFLVENLLPKVGVRQLV